MYSTNINHQQDGRQQAPDIKPAPKGSKYVLHIEDVLTDKGKTGLAIWSETLQEADHETPASRRHAAQGDHHPQHRRHRQGDD